MRSSPKFLAYLTVHLVNVDTRQLIGEHSVELKGSAASAKLTRRGVERLAQSLRQDIASLTARRYD